MEQPPWCRRLSKARSQKNVDCVHAHGQKDRNITNADLNSNALSIAGQFKFKFQCGAAIVTVIDGGFNSVFGTSDMNWFSSI